MISDVVEVIHSTFVNKGFHVFNVAHRIGKGVARYSDDRSTVQTISRPLRLDGATVRGFKTEGHVADDIREQVEKIYDSMVDELSQLSGAMPIDFRLVESVDYVVTPKGDFYTLGFIIDYVETE